MAEDKKRGRKSSYDAAKLEQARKLCEQFGATGADLGAFFGVSETTICNWQNAHPEFKAALTEGRAVADARVVRSLFERACGYSHPAKKIFCHQGEITEAEYTEHYPPDTTAAIFWLKNRRPEEWRDRHELTGKDGGAIETKDVSMLEAARRMVFLLTAGAKELEDKES